MIVIMMMIILIVLILARVVPLLVLDVVMFGDALEVGLELAVALLSWKGAHLHVDVASGHPRLLVAMAHGFEIFLDRLSQLMAEFLVGHLAAAELELDAHLVTFCEEVFRVYDLDVIVMRVDADAELKLLHLARLLVLVRLLLVLLLEVLVFAVVDDFADRRISVWSYFHQVKTALLGDPDGLMGGKDAKLMLAVLLNHADLGCANAFIDARLVEVTAAIVLAGTASVVARGAGGLAARAESTVRCWKTSSRTWTGCRRART